MKKFFSVVIVVLSLALLFGFYQSFLERELVTRPPQREVKKEAEVPCYVIKNSKGEPVVLVCLDDGSVHLNKGSDAKSVAPFIWAQFQELTKKSGSRQVRLESKEFGVLLDTKTGSVTFRDVQKVPREVVEFWATVASGFPKQKKKVRV